MVDLILCPLPVSRTPFDLVTNPMLEHYVADVETLKAAVVYKPFAVGLTITKSKHNLTLKSSSRLARTSAAYMKLIIEYILSKLSVHLD